MLAPGSDSVGAHGGVSGMSLVLAQPSDSRGAHEEMSSVESGAAQRVDSVLLTAG